jgi:peroxiredoxin
MFRHEKEDAVPGVVRRTANAKRWRGRAFQVLLLVGIYLAVSAWQERDTLPTERRAPPLRGLTLDGRELSLEQLRGNAVLLHFWATWCGVCRMELSGLNSLHARLPQNALLISVVADDQDRASLQDFVREHGIRYPVLVADAAALERFGVRAFPTNYYLDEAGMIRDVTVGMSTRWAMWLRLWLA